MGMDSDKRRSRVNDLFLEAKAKGLVDEGRRLLLLGRGTGSRALFNTIVIDSRTASLYDDAVRFTILHEESHLRRKQNSRFLTIPVIILIPIQIIATIQWAWLDGSQTLYVMSLIAVSAYLVAALLSFIFLKRWLGEDERRADMDASRALSQVYGVADPRIVAAAVLSDPGKASRAGIRRKILKALDVHPSFQARMEDIGEAAGIRRDDQAGKLSETGFD